MNSKNLIFGIGALLGAVSLLAQESLQKTTNQYRGVICHQRLVVGSPGLFSDFIARRVGGSVNLNYAGVDWIAVNTMLNPRFSPNDRVVLGAKLELVTPRISGVATNPKAQCKENKVEPPVEIEGPEVRNEPDPDDLATVPITTLKNSEILDNKISTADPSIPSDELRAFNSFNSVRSRETVAVTSAKLVRPALASASGLRVGKPVPVDAVLLPKSRMVNFFLQLKSGSFEGLTIFTDSVPEVQDEFAGQEFRLGWRRGTIGWSFNLKLPAINGRIDATPRIGYWSVDAVLPRVLDDSSLGAKEFSFERPSLGFETGIGFDLAWQFSSRFWFAKDVARAYGSDKSAGASSQRTGLDVYFPGMEFKLFGSSFGWVMMGYLMHDAVFLANKSPEVGALVKGVRETDSTDGTYYGLAYTGLGTILTF